MGKTPLIIAPAIVAATLAWLMFWIGRWYERTMIVHKGKHILPSTYNELVGVIRELLNPTNLNEIPYVPPALKQRAWEAFNTATKQEQARVRAERRRNGW